MTWWADWNWGTVPDWIAGIGTAGAFGTTALVLKRESDDRRTRLNYERSEQARRVRLGPIESGPASGKRGIHATRHFVIKATNASEDAIHDFSLELHVPNEYEVLDRREARAAAEVVAVGQVVPLEFTVTIPWRDANDHTIPTVPVRASLAFTDMTGQRWIRDHTHRLTMQTRRRGTILSPLD
jgi:hypothetical protein